MKYIQPTWPAPAKIKAYSTLQNGWYERDPKSPEARQRLKSLLHLPNEPIWINQTHSTIVLEATLENKDCIADATFTTKPHHICAILTADCLPILLCNQQGTYVAAIHAGWRGLANGIIEKTLNTATCPEDTLMAWLGPAISQQKFEVGKDVYDAFTLLHPEAANAFIPQSGNKWLANLYELAKLRLKLNGVSQIYGGDFCTFTQEDLFLSYRRSQADTARMAHLIWIEV